VDDATDYHIDTIDWLVKTLPIQWQCGYVGTLYPGYYTSVGAINSPQSTQAIRHKPPLLIGFFDDFLSTWPVRVVYHAFIFFDT